MRFKKIANPRRGFQSVESLQFPISQLKPSDTMTKKMQSKQTMKKREQLQKHTHLPSSRPLPELPSEVIVVILSRLPVDALFRFRCVCRSWYGLVRDPHFIKMQVNRAIENPTILVAYSNKIFFLEFESCDRISVVNLHPPCKKPILFPGSCNGLFCYTLEREGDIYLWNPSTGDNKRLPDVPSPAEGEFFIGYSPAMDEYKIVMISPHETDQEVWVITLGTQSWRRVERSRSEIYPYCAGVCLNGALHWTPAEYKTPNVIIVFDLGDEKFREMILPDFFNKNIHDWILIPGEHLSVQCDSFDGGFCKLWVMKEYGNEKSWIKKFSQTQTKMFGKLNIVGFLKTGEILLERNCQYVSYHPVDKRIRKLPVYGTRHPPSLDKVHNYVETLVWPVVDV